MKSFIKSKLRESFEDSYEPTDKWGRLEKDVQLAVMPIIEKYKSDFGHDSYGVIDAVQQVFDNIFQKTR